METFRLYWSMLVAPHFDEMTKEGIVDIVVIDGPGSRPWKSETCSDCCHYRGSKTCSAFPGGIPTQIWQAYRGHRSPFAGDQGIQFQQHKATRDFYDIPAFLRKRPEEIDW